MLGKGPTARYCLYEDPANVIRIYYDLVGNMTHLVGRQDG